MPKLCEITPSILDFGVCQISDLGSQWYIQPYYKISKALKLKTFWLLSILDKGCSVCVNLERMPSDWSITQLCSEILAY